jgi:hypothetical protein
MTQVEALAAAALSPAHVGVRLQNVRLELIRGRMLNEVLQGTTIAISRLAPPWVSCVQ